MKPENRLWALTMFRAVQQVLENEGIEDLRTSDEIGDKLEDLIVTIEDCKTEDVCEFCGYPVCPATIQCQMCGFDFGICSEDPYADPTCPQCAGGE